MYSVADLHNKILDASGPIFFIFMQFTLKFGQTIGWCHPSHFGKSSIGINLGSVTIRFLEISTNNSNHF